MAFSFEHSRENDVVIIRPSGDLIEKSLAQPMLDKVAEYLDEENRKFIIDMSHVRYLNSSGLNALIAVLTRTRKAGGETIISNVSPKVKELLIITRLNTVFTVTESVQQAQEKLK